MLLPACVCGCAHFVCESVHEIPVARCLDCGVLRQVVDKTPAGLASWYQTEYFAGTYYHTPDHDRRVAAERLREYHFRDTQRVLDVGAGNGAFVQVARAQGIDAWGQDVATQSDGDHVHVGELADVAFPTDHFDVVTVHDVLEHFIDPQGALKEMARVVRPGGQLIIDFPRFFHESGTHHWKPTEHLWMLTEEQLWGLIEAAGFTVTETRYPIPSKVVVYATRNAEQRASILVPAGIGDAYWVLTKLPGFLRQHNLNPIADVWVQDQGGPKRTLPFLESVATVHGAGYRETKDRQFRPLWNEAYMRNGRTIYPSVCGVDYFIAYNGILRHGRSLTDTDPSFGVEWRPKMHVSKRAQEFKRSLQAGGPYVVAYFVSSGMYSHWLREFPPAMIAETLRNLREKLGLRVVFLGAEWDTKSVGMQLAAMEPASASWVNLIGETSYEDMVGVLRGASAIVGWPSGATLLGPVFNVPTVLMWNQYFKAKGFWHYCAPPDAPYTPLDTLRLTSEQVEQAVRGMMHEAAGKYAGGPAW